MKPAQESSKCLNAGTMMIAEGLLLPKPLEVNTNTCLPRWRSVGVLDSFSLGHKLNAVGWHLCFLADHVTAIAFGHGREKSLQKAVRRVAAKVTALGWNCLELTQIARKHFVGVPYIAISAHSYHIQQGWKLQSLEERRRLQHG